jgi:hypothetical protein
LLIARPLQVMRTRVVREILSSEHIYVSNLRVLIEVFLQPLRRAAESGKGIIPLEDIKRIFSNLEDIYAYNMQFLDKLDARVSNWSVESLIGDIFLDMVGRLFIFLLTEIFPFLRRRETLCIFIVHSLITTTTR